jgi:hypothetical protein
MITILLYSLLSVANYNFTCIIKETGDLPKIKFRGQTREEAMERTVRLCMSIRTNQYFTQRLKSPSEERLITFMEDCVNNTFCVEK